MATTDVETNYYSTVHSNDFLYDDPLGIQPDNHAADIQRPHFTSHQVSNEMEHRTKPTTPWELMTNVTPQTKQYTNKCWPQLERKVTGPTAKRLYNPKRWATQTQIQEYRWSYLGIAGAPDETNWQLKARSKIASEVVNLGSSLVEYRESVRMFRDTVQILHDVYRTLRTGRISDSLQRRMTRRGRERISRMPWRLRRHVNVMSLPAAFLQANFGIKPLMNDVFSSIDVLSARLGLPIYRKIYVKGISSNYVYTYGTFAHWRRTDKANFHLLLDPERAEIIVGNPIEWAWELIPFSFVIDWMLPIGETLSSLDALKNVTWTIGTVTSKAEFTRNGIAPNPGYEVIEPYKQRYKEHSRVVHTTIPFALQPLRWDPSTSCNSALEGVALLWLLIQGRRARARRL